MGEIAGTEMWQVGRNVQAATAQAVIDPVTAGIYVATMMAQVDILREKGHPYSEIVNESIIEAIDSLNPYMDFKGVALHGRQLLDDGAARRAQMGAALRLRADADASCRGWTTSPEDRTRRCSAASSTTRCTRLWRCASICARRCRSR